MLKWDVDAFLRTLPRVEERIRLIEQEPLPRNIYALLEQACSAAPDEIAWCFFEQDDLVTYRALVARVNRLANGLASMGLRHGSRVAVMLPNIPAMPTSWLALTRMGASMVPVNTRYTARELQYLLDDSEADCLIIHQDFLSILQDVTLTSPQLRQRIVVVGGAAAQGYVSWQDLLDKSDEHFRPEVEPQLDDIANIQFTSGTTGLPKGCLLTHRYWLICAKVHARGDFLPFKRFMTHAPFFYMTSQWMLLSAFYQTGTVYVANRPSASRFIGWASKYRINFSLFDESIYRQPPSPLDRANEFMRVNIYGHTKENNRDMEQRFGFKAREGFGMTEVGAALSMPIEADDMVGSGSMGIPMAFRECRIADEQGNTLPRGQIGELLIRGPGLFKGYYRKPEATAAAFHGDWFRSGDLAWQDERGYFYFVGRQKDMIRRSGENISGREVEQVVNEIPGVVESAAVPVRDPERGEEVKVYVVLKEGMTSKDLPPEQIIALCAKSLAVFKLPRYLEYRTKPLPRTPSGTKLVKSDLLKEKPDLLSGCWDRVQGRWL